MAITDLRARQLASEIRSRFYHPSSREGIVAVVMGVLRENRVVREADCMRVIAFLNGSHGRVDPGEPANMAGTGPVAAAPACPARARQGRGLRHPRGATPPRPANAR
jgi:hypothetical protein